MWILMTLAMFKNSKLGVKIIFFGVIKTNNFGWHQIVFTPKFLIFYN